MGGLRYCGVCYLCDHETAAVIEIGPSTTMSDPLNQHLVPQVYLKGFDEGKGIIVYDTSERTLGALVPQVGKPRIETKVKHLAAEIDYYTRETTDGPDYSFEQTLGRFENLYRPIMKAVRSGRPLSDEQLGYLAVLAAVQSGRVNRMSLVEPMQQIREQAAALFRQYKPALPEQEIEEETDRFFREQFLNAAVPSPKNIALDAVPLMIDFVFNMFRFMFKSVIYSDAHDFVTSDDPVVFVDPAQFPQPQWQFFRLSPYMEVTFPLNRRACLVMAWHPLQPQFRADEAMVATINSRTANYSRKHVFATNTGAKIDRDRNGRDFYDMAVWIGMPLSATLLRDGPTTDEEGSRYQQALARLHIPLELAQEQMRTLTPRFEKIAERYQTLQEELDRQEGGL